MKRTRSPAGNLDEVAVRSLRELFEASRKCRNTTKEGVPAVFYLGRVREDGKLAWQPVAVEGEDREQLGKALRHLVRQIGADYLIGVAEAWTLDPETERRNGQMLMGWLTSRHGFGAHLMATMQRNGTVGKAEVCEGGSLGGRLAGEVW